MAIQDRIISAATVDDKWGVDLFLTGAPGAGKTAFIGTATDDPELCGKLLILDIGGGMRTVADKPDIAIAPINDWNELKEMYTFLTRSKHEYRTIAIDLISEALKLAQKEAVNKGFATNKAGRLTLEGFGMANEWLIELVHHYRLLAVDKGWNVIFTSHSNETKDESTGAVLIRPNLTPGTLSTVVGAVDVVGYLELTSRTRERKLHLIGNDRYWAKARVPQSFGQVPDALVKPTLPRLIRLLRGELPAENA